MDTPFHDRQSVRLRGFDYSASGAYFVTICTQGRTDLFGRVENGNMVLNEYGRAAESFWFDLSNHYGNIGLDAFVVMPNHIHGIFFIHRDAAGRDAAGRDVGAIHELPLRQCWDRGLFGDRIERRRMLIPKIIGRFKMNSAKRVNALRATPGVRVWQRNYYEHVIRDEFELNRLRRYIEENPQKWALDEKFQGGDV